MTFGTAHFVTIQDASNYYGGIKTAHEKLAAGEIHIGPPTLKEDERLGINKEGRYTITVRRKDNG